MVFKIINERMKSITLIIVIIIIIIIIIIFINEDNWVAAWLKNSGSD